MNCVIAKAWAWAGSTSANGFRWWRPPSPGPPPSSRAGPWPSSSRTRSWTGVTRRWSPCGRKGQSGGNSSAANSAACRRNSFAFRPWGWNRRGQTLTCGWASTRPPETALRRSHTTRVHGTMVLGAKGGPLERSGSRRLTSVQTKVCRLVLLANLLPMRCRSWLRGHRLGRWQRGIVNPSPRQTGSRPPTPRSGGGPWPRPSTGLSPSGRRRRPAPGSSQACPKTLMPWRRSLTSCPAEWGPVCCSWWRGSFGSLRPASSSLIPRAAGRDPRQVAAGHPGPWRRPQALRFRPRAPAQPPLVR